MNKSLENQIKEHFTLLEQNNLKRKVRILSPVSENRVLVEGKECLNFSSNDYLNLSTHPKLIKKSKCYLKKWGSSIPSSRLISGNYEIIEKLEKKIRTFKKSEDALFFNSGYTANIGIIRALALLSSIFLLDKKVHASILDGIRTEKIDYKRFHHNDMNHLEQLIQKNQHKLIWIVVDSVYSMDGDLAPLSNIISLKKIYANVCIYVDDAHGTGVFGKDGSGRSTDFGENIDITMGTFSKALGSFGAYVACTKLMKQFLINTCRSFIYTTALPPSVIGASIASINIIQKYSHWGEELLKKSKFFLDELRKRGYDTLDACSQIIPINTVTNKGANQLATFLQKNGVYVMPIRSPTVEKNKSRIRLSINRLHKKEELYMLLHFLDEYKRKL